jgi:hypothetical protein
MVFYLRVPPAKRLFDPFFIERACFTVENLQYVIVKFLQIEFSVELPPNLYGTQHKPSLINILAL